MKQTNKQKTNHATKHRRNTSQSSSIQNSGASLSAERPLADGHVALHPG